MNPQTHISSFLLATSRSFFERVKTHPQAAQVSLGKDSSVGKIKGSFRLEVDIQAVEKGSHRLKPRGVGCGAISQGTGDSPQCWA